jgi:hypothetical protein
LMTLAMKIFYKKRAPRKKGSCSLKDGELLGMSFFSLGAGGVRRSRSKGADA